MSPHTPEVPTTAKKLFAAIDAVRDALGELLKEQQGYLRKLIYEKKNPELSRRSGNSDVLQDAFLDVLQHIDRTSKGFFGLKSEDDLRKWLAEVGRNAVNQEERHERRGRQDYRRENDMPEGVEPTSVGPSPSSEARQKERQELTEQAVQDLGEADRMLVRLDTWHDWTHMQLAELLDGRGSKKGEDAIERRLARIRFRLKRDSPILEGLRD